MPKFAGIIKDHKKAQSKDLEAVQAATMQDDPPKRQKAGKRSNPEYGPVTVLLPLDVRDQANLILGRIARQGGQKQTVSDILSDYLRAWVDERS